MRVVRPLVRKLRLVTLAIPLAVAGCGSDSGAPDVGPPADIEVVGVVPATTVGTIVSPAPSVRVTDAEGRAVPGVPVTFAVGSGGGTATGATQTTNGQGVATVGSWRLGEDAGSNTNTLVATAGTLTTTVTIVATAGAPAIAARAPGVPAAQNVAPSTVVPIPPAVLVTDQYGNPVQGVPVQFAAGVNSGTITGAVQTTNAQGTATLGSWTVGSATGAQMVTGTAGTLPAVTFTANVGTGGGTPCDPITYALGASVNGSLASGDCTFQDGSYLDVYRVTTTAQINHGFSLTSAAFDAYLWIFSADGARILAASDDVAAGSTDAGLRLLAPPGTYLVAANSYSPGETGAYTFSSSNAPQPPGCVYTRWVVPGAQWAETVSATDCQEPSGTGGTGAGDEYGVVLDAGQSLTVTMRSTAFDAFVRLIDGETGATLVSNNDGAGGTDARATYSTNVDRLVVIVATTNLASTTGAYTIETIGSGAPALRTSPVRPALATRATLARMRTWMARGAPAGAPAKAPTSR